MAPGKNALALAASTALAVLAVGCAPNYIDFPGDQKPGLSFGSGTGGGSTCPGGKPISCYSGPPGTEGMGLCKAGVRECNADGVLERPCIGEVTPRPENCATPVDEDCDGLAPACTGKALWASRFGDKEGQAGDAIAIDRAGNVLVAGLFMGTLDFGGGPLTSSDDYGDAFVAKLDAHGNHLWSSAFGGASEQWPQAVAVDLDGNVIIVGTFWKEINFGNGPKPGHHGGNVFIVKLDAKGNYLWDRCFGDDGDNQDASSVSIDSAGNIVVIGNFYKTIDFGNGPLLDQGDALNVYVVKLDGSGNPLWSISFGGKAWLYGQSVAVDFAGDVLVGGIFEGVVDFGSGLFDSQSGNDAFVVKLDSYGNHVWSRHFGGPYDLNLTSVAFDGVGNAFIGGGFPDAVDFGGGPLIAKGFNDVFLVKLNGNGEHVWSKQFGGTKNQALGGMTVDDVGNLVLTGGFDGEIDFGGGPLASVGENGDIFLAKLDASGGHLWSKRFGGAGGIQTAWGITTDHIGNVLLTGGLYKSIDFGTGPLYSSGDNGYGDVYVAAFAP